MWYFQKILMVKGCPFAKIHVRIYKRTIVMKNLCMLNSRSIS